MKSAQAAVKERATRIVRSVALATKNLPLKWWFSGFTAVLGAFAGLLGSVWGDEIKGAFPFVWPADGPLVWSAVIFWIALLSFGMLFGFGFKAQNEATKELKDAIRTLPPRGFLTEFEGHFRQIFAVHSAAHADPSVATLRSAIKTALTGVALMIKSFDSRPDSPKYSVNVMLFRRVDSIAADRLERELLFVEPGYNTEAWDGVLQLQEEFAFTLEDNRLVPDTETGGVLLPIPKAKYRTDNGKPTILPGAPTVFCEPFKNPFAGFDNTLKLAAWCREVSGLRHSVAETIERHFTDGKGKAIRSFISIPIVSESNGNSDALGVLNVHSDRVELLPGERAALLVPMITPIMLLLARSIRALSEQSSAAPAENSEPREVK